MKHLLRYLLTSVLVSFCFAAYSQKDTAVQSAPEFSGAHYFVLGSGVKTTDYLLDGYRPGRPTEFDYANQGSPWVLYASYRFEFARRASIALIGTMEQQSGDWLDNYIPGGNVFALQTSVKGAFVRTCYTVAADFAADYVSTGMLRVYGCAGIGFTHTSETDQYNADFYIKGFNNGVNSYGEKRVDKKGNHVNINFSPVCFSFGRKLSWFMEFGFGYKGIASTGICYRLNHPIKAKNEK